MIKVRETRRNQEKLETECDHGEDRIMYRNDDEADDDDDDSKGT